MNIETRVTVQPNTDSPFNSYDAETAEAIMECAAENVWAWAEARVDAVAVLADGSEVVRSAVLAVSFGSRNEFEFSSTFEDMKAEAEADLLLALGIQA